jgi:hypothetical protein
MDAALILAGIELAERLLKLVGRVGRGEASDAELDELRALTQSKVKDAVASIDNALEEGN